jgi:hypothetical protein
VQLSIVYLVEHFNGNIYLSIMHDRFWPDHSMTDLKIADIWKIEGRIENLWKGRIVNTGDPDLTARGGRAIAQPAAALDPALEPGCPRRPSALRCAQRSRAGPLARSLGGGWPRLLCIPSGEHEAGGAVLAVARLLVVFQNTEGLADTYAVRDDARPAPGGGAKKKRRINPRHQLSPPEK